MLLREVVVTPIDHEGMLEPSQPTYGGAAGYPAADRLLHRTSCPCQHTRPAIGRRGRERPRVGSGCRASHYPLRSQPSQSESDQRRWRRSARLF